LHQGLDVLVSGVDGEKVALVEIMDGEEDPEPSIP
jgi:hypothetical protein